VESSCQPNPADLNLLFAILSATRSFPRSHVRGPATASAARPNLCLRPQRTLCTDLVPIMRLESIDTRCTTMVRSAAYDSLAIVCGAAHGTVAQKGVDVLPGLPCVYIEAKLRRTTLVGAKARRVSTLIQVASRLDWACPRSARGTQRSLSVRNQIEEVLSRTGVRWAPGCLRVFETGPSSNGAVRPAQLADLRHHVHRNNR